MLDRERMERLRESAAAEDWPLAGELYIELSHETRGTPDRVRIGNPSALRQDAGRNRPRDGSRGTAEERRAFLGREVKRVKASLPNEI